MNRQMRVSQAVQLLRAAGYEVTRPLEPIPAKAGYPWTEREDRLLRVRAFELQFKHDERAMLCELARLHMRTVAGVEQRCVHLGLIAPRIGS